MKPRISVPPDLAFRPFTHSEGLAAGLGRNRLLGRDLSTPFHGVKVAGPAPRTLLARCQAFQKRMPAKAYFSHTTAALLLNAPLSLELEQAALIHVSQPKPSRALSAQGVHGHSVRSTAADTRLHLGLRISSPARTFCELSPLLSMTDLVAVGDFLIHWRLPFTTKQELAAAVASYPGRRRHSILLAALARLDDRSESRRESILRVVLADSGITEFRANFWIDTAVQRYRADLADPVRKIVIEYQSDYHAEIKQFRSDMTRKSRLRAAGWLVIEVNADDLDNPAELAARIRSEIREWSQILAARAR